MCYAQTQTLSRHHEQETLQKGKRSSSACSQKSSSSSSYSSSSSSSSPPTVPVVPEATSLSSTDALPPPVAPPVETVGGRSSKWGSFTFRECHRQENRRYVWVCECSIHPVEMDHDRILKRCKKECSHWQCGVDDTSNECILRDLATWAVNGMFE